MKIILIPLALILAYIIGSIPIGVLAARWIGGVDVRITGSGRTGTTNVYLAAGRWGAILTVLGDICKGVLPVWIAEICTALALPSAQAIITWTPWIVSLAGILAITGHNWSVFLKFKGGAGAITTLGVLGALNPTAVIIVVCLALLALVISRMASVASLTIAGTMGIVLIVLASLQLAPWGYILFGFAGGALIVLSLRPNIVRILKKEERTLKVNN